MKYNIQGLYKKFEEVKSTKEYSDYFKDICDNSEIIYGFPFDETKAKNQISTMVGKYGDDLNWLAGVYQNGMTVVPNPPKKDKDQLKNELSYINNQIPIIALKRELTSHAFNKLLGIEWLFYSLLRRR